MIVIFSTLLLILLPHSLWAWGPIAHLDYASLLLQGVSAFAPVVKQLLSRFPYDFLYGTLAADITVGKAYVDYLYNCHNWRVGFLILHEAKDDPQRACAYGYLSHLAVDIVAHNYFVPYKIIRSYPTRTLGHVYWEMRYDATRPLKVWELAVDMGKRRFPHDDELFRRMLTRTLFSFKTNKKIFNSVLTLHRLRHWKTIVRRLSKLSRWKFSMEDADEYRRLGLEVAMQFLKNPLKASCTHVDPTGADRLFYAQEMRRELRHLTRRKLLSKGEVDRFLTRVKKGLRESLDRPSSLPTLADLL